MTTKACRICNVMKPLKDFYERATGRDGHRNDCKKCNNVRSLAWGNSNIEKRRENRLNSYRRHKEKEIAANKLWSQRNGNGSANCKKQRLKKKNAYPSWITKEQDKQIKEFYKKAALISEATGVQHHVDHIVPISGKTVSGLHVPWNLQVISAFENRTKTYKLPPEDQLIALGAM